MTCAVIDIETSGLPICKGFGNYYPFTDLEKYGNSRILQLAVALCDSDYTLISINSWVVKVDFQITNASFHGITQEISSKGDDIKIVLEKFISEIKGCSKIIAHNSAFDFNIIKSEMHRCQMDDSVKWMCSLEDVCTMKIGKNIVKARNKLGYIKYPSLKELYVFCCNEEIKNQHDAKHDVLNLVKCLKPILKNDLMQ